MPTHVYTVEIDGKEYDLEGDHEPSEAEARAAVGTTTPPRENTPPSAAATIGMMQPSTMQGDPKAQPHSLMDMAREMNQGYSERAAARNDELWQNTKDNPVSTAANIGIMAAAPGLLGAAGKVPGIIARRGAEREMAAILSGKTGTAAKVAKAAAPLAKSALKDVLKAAGFGGGYAAWRRFFD